MSVVATTPPAGTLGVAMVGYAFMGAAHSQAWRNAAAWTTEWREVLEREDVQVVDICTPGDSHAEMDQGLTVTATNERSR